MIRACRVLTTETTSTYVHISDSPLVELMERKYRAKHMSFGITPGLFLHELFLLCLNCHATRMKLIRASTSDERSVLPSAL